MKKSLISSITGLLSDSKLGFNSAQLRNIAVEHYDWNIRVAQMVDAYAWFSQETVS